MFRHSKSSVRGLVLTAVIAMTSLSGCGLLGSADDDPPAGGGGLEKTKINVATIEATDLAPFHLADKKGYFRAEGLDVAFTTNPNSQVSLAKVNAGEADIVFGSDVTVLVAKVKAGIDLRFIADGSSAAPNSHMLCTKPGSSVRTVHDLVGKRIGVAALNTASDTMSKAVMKANGVDYNAVTWVTIPLANIPAALADGTVDAAYFSEPFITQTAKSMGALRVVDVASGPTEDFPIASYAALGKFVSDNPKTVAAFQRAMKKATDEANADRRQVEPIVSEFAKIDQDTATLITFPNYHFTMEPRRLQRVPDLMLQFGIIPQHIDITSMIASQVSIS